MPPSLEVTLGPRHDMADADPDFLITAGAPVDLARLIGLHAAYDVFHRQRRP